MQNFELHLPTRIIFGKERHKDVGKLIKERGFQNVLFIYGGNHIKRSGLYDVVIDALKDSGLNYYEVGGVQPNPTVSFCRKVIAEFKVHPIDFVLAVGGGSVIDTGKMIAHGIGSGLDPWAILYEGAVIPKSIPIGVILTTSAAGSETSYNAVLTNEEMGFKAGCTSDFNRPMFAIMNPELTFTSSPYQIACGVVDIMMHTMERYIALDDGDNDLTDRMAEGLLKAVIRAGKRAYENPQDYEAQATLMLAGSWSHNGMMNAGRKHNMPAHTIEHGLSGLNDKVAHGAGLAIIWPAFLKFIYKYHKERFVQYAVRIWNCEMDYFNPERTIEAGIKATEDYFASLNMPSRLSDVGVYEKDIDFMVERSVNYGKRTVDSLIPLGRAEIAEIYRMCL